MSLLKNLNPEVRKMLDADQAEYPNLHKSIMRDIEEAELVRELTLNTASHLVDYYESAGLKFDSDSFILKTYKVFGK